jgi:hypothetical protein
MTVALGSPSPGGACLTRATIPAQGSPRLRELMVQAPKPDHRGQREWTFGVSHPEKWRENDVGTQRPLPGAPTVSVRSHRGPKPTSESNAVCP